jgi:hypothetical protein
MILRRETRVGDPGQTMIPIIPYLEWQVARGRVFVLLLLLLLVLVLALPWPGVREKLDYDYEHRWR